MPKMHPDQIDMFANVNDFGVMPEKQTKGRWYVVTRKWNSEALYMINGRHEWREYDPITSVPHSFTSVMVARNVASNFSGGSVRVWPYGVLRPGRGK